MNIYLRIRMNVFTIKDIENLSGIKAHTWRIWEQRYSIGVSQRKDSNHRFYDNENLKQILRIAYLYHSGIRISKIAVMEPEGIKKMAMSKLPTENGNEFYIKELLEASIDLDEERFERTFSESVNRTGIEETFLKIVKTFQEKIGVLWLTDHVIPAQEHFTSNIIRRKLSVAIDNLSRAGETQKKEFILFTPEREQHEIPLQFICYLLKKKQHNVIYFGCNVSLETIAVYMRKHAVQHLLFYLATNLTNKMPDEYLQEVSGCFPLSTVLMAGAQVGSITQIPANARLLKDVNELMDVAG